MRHNSPLSWLILLRKLYLFLGCIVLISVVALAQDAESHIESGRAGNDAQFSFELRQGKGRQNIFGHISFVGQAVKLGHISGHRMRAKTLGKYREKRWHKIVMSFPEEEGGDLQAELFVLSATVPGKWQSLGRQHAETRRSNGSPLYLTLNTSPNKTGYELFLDELKWTYPINKKLKHNEEECYFD